MFSSIEKFFDSLTTSKAIGILVIVGIIVYLNALFNNFAWDDIAYIVENVQLHNFNILQSFQINLFNNSGQYRPLSVIYFSILYTSDTTFFYHLIQLALHITNTIFVFIFFRKYLKSGLALLLSLIFLIHPVQVESVSYISAAGGVLSFFFGMLGILILSKKHIKSSEIFLIALLFLLSLLSKESGLLLGIVAIIFVYLFNKNYLSKTLISYASSLVIYLVIRFGLAGVYFESRPLIPIDRLDLVHRLFNIPEIWNYYFKALIFPINLSIYQQWLITSINLRQFYIPLFIMIIFLVTTFVVFLKFFRNKEDEKPFLFFFVWAILGFGFYSQIFPLDMTVADRWMYAPLVGVLGLIGVILKRVVSNKNISLPVVLSCIFIIILLSSRTIVRNLDWYDSITLFSHDIKYQTNFLMENDYAQYLLRVKNYKEAIIHEKKSIALFSYEQNLLGLGNLYELSGNNIEATRYYELAIKSNSYIPWKYKHIVFTYIRLSKMLLKQGKPEESLKVAKQGLEDYTDPQYTQSLWLLVALSQSKLNDYSGAIISLQNIQNINSNKLLVELYNKLNNKEQIELDNYLKLIP